MTPIPSGLSRVLASPVARCGAATLASLAVIAGCGGPQQVMAASPEIYLLLLGIPASMCIFHAAQYLLDTIAAARATEGDDGTR